MKKLLWIGLCLLPWQAPLAQSEDCGKLAAPEARLDCQRRVLDAAEADLGALYRDLMDDLDEAQRAALAEEQEAWLAQRAERAAEQRYTALRQRLEQLQDRAPAAEDVGKVEEAAAAPSGGEIWKIQTGSFRAREQAESERQRLAGQGVEATVEQAGKWYVVRLAADYADQAEAEKQRRAFQKQSGREALLVKREAAPGLAASVAAPAADTVLALLFAGRDGQGPLPAQLLYPLAVRDAAGQYQAPGDREQAAALLARFKNYSVFDRGLPVGDFLLEATETLADCGGLTTGRGRSDLSEEYFMLSDAAAPDAGLREGALLALNRESPANAPQPLAMPLDSNHLALSPEQEDSLLALIKKTLQDQAKKLLKKAALAQPLSLNIHALNVYDLDGDGGVEYFAVVTAPLKTTGDAQAVASLFLWASLQEKKVTPLFSLFSGPLPDAPAEPAYRLLDILDIDADQAPEMVLQINEGRGYRFEIYSYRQGKFVSVFAGTPLGCGN